MKKLIALSLMVIMVLGMFTGCGAYPTYEVIQPHETAFLIDYLDNGNQSHFESEEALMASMVATKEVEIPHRRVKTGFMSWEKRPTMVLIKIDRSPVTREWSSTKDVGTSTANQAIYAESSESIGFSAGMNCSAQIYTEADAARFLYSYNNASLATIMDSEIRARVESKFVEECAKRTLNEILQEKEEIMKVVRDDVTSYFAEKGITITVLGMKDGLEYDDPAIQQAINEKFSSEMKLTTQENENQRILSAANAAAEAERIKAEAEVEINKMLNSSITNSILQKMFYDKWNGVLPQVVGDGDYMIDLPMG